MLCLDANRIRLSRIRYLSGCPRVRSKCGARTLVSSLYPSFPVRREKQQANELSILDRGSNPCFGSKPPWECIHTDHTPSPTLECTSVFLCEGEGVPRRIPGPLLVRCLASGAHRVGSVSHPSSPTRVPASECFIQEEGGLLFGT